MHNRHKLLILGLASLGLLASAPAIAEPTTPLSRTVANTGVSAITQVDVLVEQGATRIVLVGSAPFTPEVTAMRRPAATIITMPGVWEAGRTRTRRVGKNDITLVRSGQFTSKQVRVVANARKAMDWVAVPGTDRTRWEIVLAPQGSAALETARAASRPVAAPKAVADEEPSIPVRETGVPAPAVRPTVRPVALAAAPKPAPVAAPKPVAAPAPKPAPAPKQAVAAAPKPAPAPKPIPAPAPKPTLVLRPTPALPAPAPVPAPAAPQDKPQDLGSRMVSLDFVAADITDVLKAISLQSGVNIVAGSSVQGKVTVALKNVALREALDWVTRLSGFRYVQQGTTFVVGTGKEVALLARTSQIGNATSAAVSFFYADGGSLVTSIQSVFPNVNVSLVNVNPESKKGDPTLQAVPGQFGGGVPFGPDSVPMGSPVPRGGVINVVGSADEVVAVRKFVEDTERSMVESSERDIETKMARMANHTTEIVEVRYVNPLEMMNLLREQVPSLVIRIGPQQRMVGNPAGGSVTFGGAGGVGGGMGGIGGGMGGIGGGMGGIGGGMGGIGGGMSMGAGGVAAGGIGGGLGFGGMQQTQASALLISGPEVDVTRAKALAAKLDQRAPQFIFEAEVYDVNSDDVDQFGLTYDLSRPITVGERDNAAGAGTGTGTGAGAGAGAQAATPNRDLGFGAILRTPYSFGVQIQALVRANKAKVLARPKLLAQDNLPAMAFIGDQFNYVVNIQQTPQGQNVTTGTATVGITLRVTGKASGDGMITLYVHPEVSTITGYLTVGSFALPQTSTRFVDTTIRVKDGETIAIGGLVRSEEFTNRQYVPFLGQLPVIGQLFQSTNKQKRKSEVMVFLTARMVKD